MKPVTIKTLVKLIREFAELTSSRFPMQEEGINDVNSTLAAWMQAIDSHYSSLFMGWMLAQGYDIDSFTHKQLGHAIQIAAVGDNKNVMFDWLGDTDGTTKPH